MAEAQKSPKLDPTVVQEINKAYYSSRLEEPDRARTRALNGFTVTSAIAAALVAAGAVGGFRGQPATMQALGCLTVFLWLAAGSSYLAAVAGWRRKTPPQQQARTAEESAKQRIARVNSDLKTIRRLIGGALRVSLLAVVATGTLLGLTILGTDTRKDAIVVLTPEGAQTLAQACGESTTQAARPIHAKVDPEALDNAFVDLSLDGCVGGTDVRIASAMIRVISISR
jgi:hypothetical protein